jgi:hypothetical protein
MAAAVALSPDMRIHDRGGGYFECAACGLASRPSAAQRSMGQVGLAHYDDCPNLPEVYELLQRMYSRSSYDQIERTPLKPSPMLIGRWFLLIFGLMCFTYWAGVHTAWLWG